MEKSSTDARVREQLEQVNEQIDEACRRAGRAREEVKLLAVTKTVDPERIHAAIRAGVTAIGENRVQEFCRKRDELHLDGVEAHLIGHLQTNKVRQIVGKVQMIESVDSVHLAQKISDCSVERGIVTPVLAEVNIGGETSKTGISPDLLLPMLETIGSFPGISVRGLMTIAPILPSESEKRQIFSKMYQLFVDIRTKNIDNISMQELSMGMSGDFREAILEGATVVRIGSAIFGKRE